MFGKTALYAKDFDWFIFLLALAIAVIGVVEIHSATQYDRAENFYVKQIYRILIGLFLMVLVMSIDYHALAENVPYLYAAAVLSLLAVLLFGKRVSGSKSWISLGGFFRTSTIRIGQSGGGDCPGSLPLRDSHGVFEQRRDRQGISRGRFANSACHAATRSGFSNDLCSHPDGRALFWADCAPNGSPARQFWLYWPLEQGGIISRSIRRSVFIRSWSRKEILKDTAITRYNPRLRSARADFGAKASAKAARPASAFCPNGTRILFFLWSVKNWVLQERPRSCCFTF